MAAALASLEKIAEGREADVFAWEPGVIFKLYRDESSARQRETELLALTAVHEAGGRAPRVLGPADVQGRPSLLMERLDRDDLLTEIGKAPWKVVSTGGLMGQAHALLNQKKAPRHLQRLNDRLRERFESSLVPRELRQVGIDALADLSDGDRLCHGDFHPANVIRGPRGGTVIDSSNAMAGDAAADVAQTLLILNIGEPPPGTVLVIRRLDSLGRRIIRSRYLAAYSKRHRIDSDLTAKWALPLRSARLSHRIEQERDKLLALIGRSQTGPAAAPASYSPCLTRLNSEPTPRGCGARSPWPSCKAPFCRAALHRPDGRLSCSSVLPIAPETCTTAALTSPARGGRTGLEMRLLRLARSLLRSKPSSW